MNGFDGTTGEFDTAIPGSGEKRTLEFALPKQADRRKTPRIHVQIPMFVYGYVSGDVPFHEEAHTIAIHEQGGLICMQTPVQPGQRLLVVNEANERTQECLVVFAETRLARGIAVEFKFLASMAQFWHDLEIGPPRERALAV